MQADLYNILQAHRLAYHRVIVALTSRDICSITDFLEKGDTVLKRIGDARKASTDSLKFKNWAELHTDDIQDGKLLTLTEQRKLEKILNDLKSVSSTHQTPEVQVSHIGSLLRQLQDL